MSLLKEMKLTDLNCGGTPVSDLSPIKDMPLTILWCDFKPQRDTDLLRSIKTLETINGKPAAAFWKEVEAQQAAFDRWMKQVSGMPAEEQVKAVIKKLQELNQGFDGKETHKIENDVVTELRFLTYKVADISPVGALTGLKHLACTGDGDIWGKLSDLFPLKQLSLKKLECFKTEVSDLSPLKDMPLTSLMIGGTQVSDLTPLRGMSLSLLYFDYTHVSNLSPLKGMSLTDVSFQCTPVSDLSPLLGMPLTTVECYSTQVSDLSPLKNMPLKVLNCDFKPERDTEILRSIKSLETINQKPAAEFWKEVESKK